MLQQAGGGREDEVRSGSAEHQQVDLTGFDAGGIEGAPRRLFMMPSGSIGFWPAPGYQRFLISRPLENAAPPQLTVLTGWWSALKKK